MLRRRRPKIRRLARKNDAKRLVRALDYHDQLSDNRGRVYDLGAGVRRDAATALTSVADTGDVDIGIALIRALGDTSGEVRRAAASALGARREGRAAAALAEAALTWPVPRYEAARLAAADALTDLSGPESAEQLVRVVIEQPADIALARELVTRMLAKGGDETARSACATAVAALSTVDRAKAERAVEVVSWLGQIAVEPLLAALDGAQAARVPVIQALGRLGDLSASGGLVRQLSDVDADVRAAAAAALGQIADPSSAQALVAASSDPDQLVRAAALEAIHRLGPFVTTPEASGAATAPPGGVAQADDGAARRGARTPHWLRSSSA
jgi:HEAT repeat protein